MPTNTACSLDDNILYFLAYSTPLQLISRLKNMKLLTLFASLPYVTCRLSPFRRLSLLCYNVFIYSTIMYHVRLFYSFNTHEQLGGKQNQPPRPGRHEKMRVVQICNTYSLVYNMDTAAADELRICRRRPCGFFFHAAGTLQLYLPVSHPTR